MKKLSNNNVKVELGKWDNLVIGHCEIEQRKNANEIIKCMIIKGRTTYPDYICIERKLIETDPNGFLKNNI